MKTKIETSKAPKAMGPFSQAIIKDNFFYLWADLLNNRGKIA